MDRRRMEMNQEQRRQLIPRLPVYRRRRNLERASAISSIFLSAICKERPSTDAGVELASRGDAQGRKPNPVSYVSAVMSSG